MKNRVQHPRSRHAFTLVELLVVVSIITLLIAILLPSLGKSKAKASQIACGAKLKGLTTAMSVYVNEYNGVFPVNGLVIPKSGVPDMYDPAITPGANPFFAKQEEKTVDKWRVEFGALWTYMGGPALPTSYTLPLPLATENMRKGYICSSDVPGLQRTYTGTGTGAVQPLYLDIPTDGSPPHVKQGVGSPGYWSYSVNSVLNSMGRFRNRFNAGELPWSDPLHIITVKKPQSLVAFIEEDNNSLFNDEVMDAPAYSQGDQITNRHNGGGSVGFVDGHVEFFNQTIFDQVPSAITGTYVQHSEAMTSPITRMFFPDDGAFAN